MIGCFEIHVPTKPLHAQCTECGHEQEVTWEEIPDYGDLMTLDHFIQMVKCGGFINYDGMGNLATKDKMSCLEIRPSMIKRDIIYQDSRLTSIYTHVVWFNR